MMAEFELNEKLCYADKTPFTETDMEFTEEPLYYNGRVKNAISSLQTQLPTFALVDDGIELENKLCFLIEKGNFWGMGYISSTLKPATVGDVKECIEPFADNDFIRNSIYNYAERNPEKKILLS